MVASLDDFHPARHLLRHRRKYFIGVLDPCASIEFTRGCPWDCSFCSAWTFYGRSYRAASPEKIVEDLASVREPGVFIVDDVAFIQAKQGMAIGDAVYGSEDLRAQAAAAHAEQIDRARARGGRARSGLQHTIEV